MTQDKHDVKKVSPLMQLLRTSLTAKGISATYTKLWGYTDVLNTCEKNILVKGQAVSPWATRKVTANVEDQQNQITQHDVFWHTIHYLQWQSITLISLMLSELKILGRITLPKIWLLLLFMLSLLQRSKSFAHKHTHYLRKHKRFKWWAQWNGGKPRGQ